LAERLVFSIESMCLDKLALLGKRHLHLASPSTWSP